MSIMGVERDEDGLTYEEQRKEADRWYRALEAENERLRAALLQSEQAAGRFVPDVDGGHLLMCEKFKWYPASLLEGVRAENERLREALAGMIEYASYNEVWQDDHPEYIEKARQLLGEERLSPSSVVLIKISKSNSDFDEYVIEPDTTGGEK